jgi:hypothetical protein
MKSSVIICQIKSQSEQVVSGHEAHQGHSTVFPLYIP